MRNELTAVQRDWWNANYDKLSKMIANRTRCHCYDTWQNAIANSVAICWQEFLREPDRYVNSKLDMGAYDLARRGVYRTNKKHLEFGSEHKGRESFYLKCTRSDYRDTVNVLNAVESREIDPAIIVEVRLDFAEWYSGLEPQEKLVIQYLLGGHSLSGKFGIDGKLKTTLRTLRRMMARLEAKWVDYHAGILSLYAALEIMS